MNTLYISDLDGTLLRPDATVSDITSKRLKLLTEAGALISISTARSIYDLGGIFEKLSLSAPVALMNGTLIATPDLKKILHYESIEKEACRAALEIFTDCSCEPNMYKYSDNGTDVFFTRFVSDECREFYEKRRKTYRSFKQVSEYDLSGEVVFFSTVADEARIKAAAERLERVRGLGVAFYKDVYYKSGWFLEVSSARASKASALQRIKKLSGAEHCVTFGDNMNDIPMLRAADISVAVANARDEVRQIASAVIGNNSNDAVSEYIFNSYFNGKV